MSRLKPLLPRDTQLGLIASFAMAMGACGGEVYEVNHEEIYSVDGKESYLGGGCDQLSDGATSSTGAGGEDVPPYALHFRGMNAGVAVSISGADESLLAEKHFGAGFLKSGDVDEVIVTLENEKFLRLRVWGGEKCDTPRDPGSH